MTFMRIIKSHGAFAQGLLFVAETDYIFNLNLIRDMDSIFNIVKSGITQLLE